MIVTYKYAEVSKMSRKHTLGVFQTKTTQNDRFAQMSHQEKIIEEKRKEIQTRMEQKLKTTTSTTTTTDSKTSTTTSTTSNNTTTTSNKSTTKILSKFDLKNYNQFSNDGSFLDQFKQLKDKKMDQKLKSFRTSQDKNYGNEDRNKNSRWSNRHRSPSPKNKIKLSRFSEKYNEPKINISTSYSNLISQPNFNVHPQIQNQITINRTIIGPPLMKNDIPPPRIAFPTPAENPSSVIAAPPLMLTVPPPQILQQSVSVALVAPPPTLTTTAILTSVSSAPNLPSVNLISSLVHPPVSPLPVQNTIGITNPQTGSTTVNLLTSCVPTLELSSIPPPNPIQIQNIPQPEPINTHNIPPPAPLQVQNIPPPSPIQLNEIPNPKPLDVINIPTPGDGDCLEKTMSDPDFIKSIPPPNKSIPPPSLQDTTINVNIAVPPPTAIHAASLLHPQTIGATQNISIQNILPSQNIVVHSVPPPQIISTQCIQTLPTVQNVTLVPQQTVQNLAPIIPPPPPPPQQVLPTVSTISVALSVQNPITGGVITASSTSNVIPSLLAQPVLPPPGINVTTLPVNIHCPPPSVVLTSTSPSLTTLPPSYVNQPPPISTQLPPVNVPPPSSTTITVTPLPMQQFKDLNSVCPPGTPEYEAMASLGRMVVQCGPGIEDVVRQRKHQDPNLWFLFYKESVTYQQYLQLIEQFKLEAAGPEIKEENYKPEDIYEPEMGMEEDFDSRMKQEEANYRFLNIKQENEDESSNCRKRRSRWDEKDSSTLSANVVLINPPTIVVPPQIPLIPNIQGSNTMLSKITRNDPALIQYAVNTYGTTNLTEEDWKITEDNFKINLVYQEMLRKRDEVQRMMQSGKNKYEYDSDEDTDGGTWEHKLRNKEMTTTHIWATELTKNAEGKHHIGDFLPPEEFKRFMETSSAVKEGREPDFSDYKDFKLKEDNVGFKMLKKLGWSEGQGLGASASGIIEPVNKATLRDQNQGLGVANPGNLENNDDEYDAYRKRMMLAYRFRPNPLNNPRRPYY